MSVYARVALGLAAFLFVAGSVYAATGHEFVGAPLMLITAATFTFLGLYVRRTIRAAAAEGHAEEAEEPHVGPTIWPFVLSLGAIGLALGAVVGPWLLAVGGVLAAVAVVGWFLDVGRQWGHGGRVHGE
jgi:Cytochrome c oxidase subunit IV